MIKVLNKNIDKQKLYKECCLKCSAELEFAFDDTYEGVYGARCLKCPVCRNELITDIDGVDLTSDNIKFPIHFHKMGENAVDIKDEEIQKWIRTGLRAFEIGDAEAFYFCGTGNALMIMLEQDDAYDIYVMKNYWDCSVSKTNIGE